VPALTGESMDVPVAAEGIVSVEGAAGTTARIDERGCTTAWLFQPDRPPSAVALDAMQTLVAADENFVWIDLSDYREDDLRTVVQRLGLHRAAAASSGSSTGGIGCSA